jgi:hypothetical protein
MVQWLGVILARVAPERMMVEVEHSRIFWACFTRSVSPDPARAAIVSSRNGELSHSACFSE